jgi:hypothetical protein
MALERAIGAEPLSEVWLPYRVRNARRLSGPALRAGTGPLRWVAEDAKRLQTGEEELLPIRVYALQTVFKKTESAHLH